MYSGLYMSIFTVQKKKQLGWPYNTDVEQFKLEKGLAWATTLTHHMSAVVSKDP